MKRLILALSIVALYAVNAFATPYTWNDKIDFNPDQPIGTWETARYTHDLTDNSPVAFIVGLDSIDKYVLTVRLFDDGGRFDFIEIALIDQPGLLGDGFYDFTKSSNNFDWSLSGRYQLNTAGTLDVAVTSVVGDFYLDYSELKADGNHVAPVPEPGTMVLLGVGLLGLAIFGKRRMGKA